MPKAGRLLLCRTLAALALAALVAPRPAAAQDKPVSAAYYYKVRWGFQQEFERYGPRDRRGRSLKQLDLETRLFRYPCSYMIYSPAFDGLPGATKDAIYARMWEILSGKDHDRRYAKLTPTLRAEIVSILIDTKPGLPPYFQS